VQVLVPAAAGSCPPHDFVRVVLKNDAKKKIGGLNAGVAAVAAAGVNGQAEHDYGERLVSICSKCNKYEGDLGSAEHNCCDKCCVT